MEFSREFGYVPAAATAVTVEDHERSSSRTFSYEYDHHRQPASDQDDDHHSRLRVFLPSYSDHSSYVSSSSTAAAAAAAAAAATAAAAGSSPGWQTLVVHRPQHQLLNIFPDHPDHDHRQFGSGAAAMEQYHPMRPASLETVQSYHHGYHHQVYDQHNHHFTPSSDEIYHNNSSSSTTSSTTASYHQRDQDELLTKPGSSSHHLSSLYQYEHLFYKVVTPSDVGKLNRLVIPKQHAERCFPLDPSLRKKGRFLSFQETFTGKVWWFRYSYWNSSQSYVFTKGWIRFVKENKLKAGDIVSFERGSPRHDQNFYISCRKRPRTPSDDQPAGGTSKLLLHSSSSMLHQEEQRSYSPDPQQQDFFSKEDEDEEEEPEEEEEEDRDDQREVDDHDDEDNVTGSTSSSQQHQQQQTMKLFSSSSSTRLFGVDLAATACCSSAESKSWDL